MLLTLCDPNGNAGDVINEIYKFQSLVSLSLPNFRITLDQVSQLTTHLPGLTELVVGIVDVGPEIAEKIHLIISMLPQLSQLEIHLNARDFDQLPNELQSSINDFHARFVRSNTEIRLRESINMIAITTDYLFMVHKFSVELHWMNNLNEMNVRKLLKSWRFPKALKFGNRCVDHIFDISALAYLENYSVEICLDIKSNGAISVKSKVSENLSTTVFVYMHF